MTIINPTPLKGIMLAGYAKANANDGVAIVAQKCGYGSDIKRFIETLQSVCSAKGIENVTLSKLMAQQCQIRERQPMGLADVWPF
ncbi:MAG: hypothetical protein AAF959_11605 [Cyanobacteria bacterium P01_D01_bin.56]